mgnify:CR=1 FL=1
MKKPKIRLTLIDRKGAHPCHRGHKIGDSFDFDTQRGELCPMACHVAFPYIDILRYGGHLPSREDGTFAFCCPDVCKTHPGFFAAFFRFLSVRPVSSLRIYNTFTVKLRLKSV